MTSEANGPDSATPDEAAEAGPRIALVTLGMHRSGTSALSGVLARLGCDTPATPMDSDTRNTKGFYESRPISDLNNRVLASAGTAWDEWSAVEPAWFDSPRRMAFAAQAQELVESEFGASPLIVLKDPRISLLMPLWVEVLGRAGYDTRVVFACRGASEVAASLTERNGFDPALGRLIWLRYVLEAEHASRALPRVFVSYDRLLADWSAEIARVETGLKLRLPRRSPRSRAEIEEFLTPSMRHYTADAGDREIDAASHGWIRDTHAVFDRWTRDGEDPADRAALDRIGAAFGAAFPAFDPLIRIAKGRAGAEAALKARLKEVDEALAQRTAAAREDREALGRAEARISALESMIGARDQTAGALEDKLASLRVELERRAEVLLGCEQQADDRDHALAELTKRQVGLQRDLETAEAAAARQRDRDAAELRAACDEAETRSRESDVALARANAEITRILASRSIRLTAPLRHLVALVARR